MSQYTFLPRKNKKLARHFDNHIHGFWQPHEIDMAEGREVWDTIDTPTQYLIKLTLAFFSQADGLINHNLFHRFKLDTEFIKECSHFYGIQEAMEWIHGWTYSLLIEEFIQDKEEKKQLFDAGAHFESIERINQFMEKWMDSDESLPVRVIAFICAEGILFSSSFASIYWIKKRNILKGLWKANEWIARDEGLHMMFGIDLFHTLITEYNSEVNEEWLNHKDYLPERDFRRPSEEKIHTVVNEAVDVALNFVEESLSLEPEGLKAVDMCNYVRNIADKILAGGEMLLGDGNQKIEGLGYSKIYNVTNPFVWMATLGLDNKTNFFEDTVTEYGKIEGGDEVDYEDVDVDF